MKKYPENIMYLAERSMGDMFYVDYDDDSWNNEQLKQLSDDVDRLNLGNWIEVFPDGCSSTPGMVWDDYKVCVYTGLYNELVRRGVIKSEPCSEED